MNINENIRFPVSDTLHVWGSQEAIAALQTLRIGHQEMSPCAGFRPASARGNEGRMRLSINRQQRKEDA